MLARVGVAINVAFRLKLIKVGFIWHHVCGVGDGHGGCNTSVYRCLLPSRM